MKFNRFTTLLSLSIFSVISSCTNLINLDKPNPQTADEGIFYKTKDSTNIFVYTFGEGKSNCSIYVITGYTGINHNSEMAVLSSLSDNNANRVIVIHPRGTGYSDGKRGDVAHYNDFINDYSEIINWDIENRKSKDKVILYGHSISTAMCLVIEKKLIKTDGIILINPPYIMKSSKGMTPGLFDYLKYIGYMIFAPHNTIVNMAGESKYIQNEQERIESEMRSQDPLLVKYISMYMMIESKNILDKMVENAKKMNCQLLLIYGSADSIVDKKGCDQIYDNWHGKKQYEIIENGPHGTQTVIWAMGKILNWIKEVES